MRARITSILTVLALLLAGVVALRAEDAAGIRLSGAGVRETVLTRQALAALPAVELNVAFQTSKGDQRGRYKGPLLWTVLTELGKLDREGHHPELKRSFTVTGSDGYAIVFSVGEIAPEFGATQALIALAIDGATVPGGERLRLVVPGDRRGARHVRDLASIEIR